MPGAPLEIRWSLKEGDDWAITATRADLEAVAGRRRTPRANGRRRRSPTIGDPAKIPLPVDISITADGKGLWVNTFMDGTTRYFDLSNPEAPKQTYAKQTGSQVNMVSQSWDGKRVYISTSLLANWDKKGADDEQFVKLFAWDGKELKETWKVDFYKLKLGRAHHMKFGARPMRSAPRRGEPGAGGEVTTSPLDKPRAGAGGSPVISAGAGRLVRVACLARCGVVAGRRRHCQARLRAARAGQLPARAHHARARRHVLDSDGSVHRFSEFSTGKVTVFSFIYTYCTDPKGCPLAYETLHSLKQTIEQRPGPARQGALRQHELRSANTIRRRRCAATAARMRATSAACAGTSSPPRSGKQLAPLLDGFGQDVSVAAEQPPNQRVPALEPHAQGLPARRRRRACAKSTPPRSCILRCC